jgi:mono/diheme cytochrome c family protein
MISSITYHNTWDRASRGRHLLFGIGAALFALLAGFFINSIWAFMLVPGKWMETHSRWDAFFTPILFESSVHILLPCLINASLLVFLWTFWKSCKTSGTEQAYYRKMNAFTGRTGAILLFLQPLSGISFLFKVKSATENLPAPNPWAHLTGGLATPFLIAMISLAAIAAFCSALYWALGHDRGRKALIVAALAMFVAFFTGAFARERARKPYLVWNTMGMNQQFIKPAPNPTSAPAQTQASASQTALTQSALAASGAEVFKKAQCMACHSFKGEGGTFGPDLNNLKPKFDRPKLMAFLRQPPPPVNMSMTPFTGSEDELSALADHLLK